MLRLVAFVVGGGVVSALFVITAGFTWLFVVEPFVHSPGWCGYDPRSDELLIFVVPPAAVAGGLVGFRHWWKTASNRG